MRSARRLAVLPLVLLTLAACTGGDDAAPAPEESMTIPAIEGRGEDMTLPEATEQSAALASTGDVVEAWSGALAADEEQTGQAEVAAGQQSLRVACTSEDGAPVTVTVSAAGEEVTSFQAPCVPVYQGGTTMADGDPFEVPGGVVDVVVVAAAASTVAVGLVAAG